MAGGGPLAVREYGPDDVARMKADAARLRAKAFSPAAAYQPPKPVVVLPPIRPFNRGAYLAAMTGMEPADHSRRSVLRVVAAVARLESEDLFGITRGAAVVRARQIVMFLCREYLASTWHEIGLLLNRDHTSCIYGHRKVAWIATTLSLPQTDDIVLLASALWAAEWPAYNEDIARAALL